MLPHTSTFNIVLKSLESMEKEGKIKGTVIGKEEKIIICNDWYNDIYRKPKRIYS